MSESERLVQGQPKKISHDQPLAWLQPHRTSESVSHFLASSKCDYFCRSCCFLFFFLMSSIVSPQSLVLFSFFCVIFIVFPSYQQLISLSHSSRAKLSDATSFSIVILSTDSLDCADHNIDANVLMLIAQASTSGARNLQNIREYRPIWIDQLCCRMYWSCMVTKYVASMSKVDMISFKASDLACPKATKHGGV